MITITGEVGNTIPITDTATFTLTLKNPCIDSNFVTIEPAVLLNKQYELHEHDPDGLQFIHDPFVVKTLPNPHFLCGDLTYSSTF